jgi:uncharacterized membrane protein YdbT with pleckstrin-like domain
VGISPNLLNDGERVVIDTRTHLKALLGPLLVLVALLALAGWLASLVDNGTARMVLGAIVLVLMLWLVIRPLLIWLTSTYTVTNRRLITRTGIFTRRGHDIPLSRISDVAYEKGIIDRMLGCGTLIVSDASTNGRVLLHDIPRVESNQRTINQLLHDASSGDDGT